MKNKVILPLVVVFFLSACSDSQREWLIRFFKVGGSAVPVAVQMVSLQERETKIVVPAVLAPSERVEVRLPYEAHIENVFVNIGDAVKMGTLLCRLSEEDLNMRLSSLKADMREAQAALEKNTYLFRNRDRLLEDGRIDKNQYDSLEADVATSEAEQDRLRLQISSLETQAANLAITSPAAGIINSKMAAPGFVVSEKQPLFVITKVDPISVDFTLAPYEARTVRQGMPALVRFRELPGETVNSAITSVGSEINADTGRFKVTAQIPNPEGVYKLGMTAQVEFAGAEKQKFFQVPSEAVITDMRKQYVFTVSMGAAHKVGVVLKEMGPDYAEIIEGLQEGDLVVVKGNKQLKEGSVVDIWGR